MPEPPYYAVIFTSRRTDTEDSEYSAMAEKMERLAAGQDGYLGIESARSDDGLGITISYWADLDCIHKWRENTEHKDAQQQGRSKWYEQYQVRIARVEREYGFP